MLRQIELENVGPARAMSFGPVAPRLNLITGDNGLGKSFLLETAWWALTRIWNGAPAVPHAREARITYSFNDRTEVVTSSAEWSPGGQVWRRRGAQAKLRNPGLVIYSGVDGAFSTWDPARNGLLYGRAP